jgi:alkaline phosphatase D
MSNAFDDHVVDLEQLDTTKSFGRRSFMIGALATGATVAAPVNYAAIAKSRRVPIAKNGAFKLGVGSGFPRPNGIVLWTELSEITRTSKLRVAVSTDPKFKNTVYEKDVVARSDRGFTTRVFVRKLKPRTEYYYRFFTKNQKSEVGRFRTAPPPDSLDTIRIAYFSCQNYEAGFFNAQQAIAQENDIDLVVCLGDYMYEYSDAKDPQSGVVRADTTGRNGDGDVQFIDEYRQKYRLYKSDPSLKAMHAAHPFISVWDDHEVEDNHADGQPSSAQKDPNKTNLKDYPRRVPYLTRRMNGYQAFFNYMPRTRFKGDRDRIYEDYRLGKNVDLLLTDERQYRDQQPCDDEILGGPCADAESPRTLLGAKQKEWLKRTFKNSPANWKIWGTQLMLMSLRASPAIGGQPGNPAQLDAWDGYSAERKEILDYVIDNGVPNIVAITGDIHTFFTGTAYTTGDTRGRPAFPEFVGGSATSTGVPEATGLTDGVLDILAGFNRHIDFYDFHKRGYGLVEATPGALTCEFKFNDAKVAGAPTGTLAKWQALPGVPKPQRII